MNSFNGNGKQIMEVNKTIRHPLTPVLGESVRNFAFRIYSERGVLPGMEDLGDHKCFFKFVCDSDVDEVEEFIHNCTVIKEGEYFNIGNSWFFNDAEVLAILKLAFG